MDKQAGIWIDHREAFLVTLGPGGEVTERIESGMEKHVRYAGRTASEEGIADDQRDRQYATHLEHFYDNVITHLGGTKSLFVLGPGEARGEFAKRVAAKAAGMHIVGSEAADKMTDAQIAAKVRQHFHT